jgi:hypothetical protein
MLSKISQTQKEKFHIFSHVQKLDIKRKIKLDMNINGGLYKGGPVGDGCGKRR